MCDEGAQKRLSNTGNETIVQNGRMKALEYHSTNQSYKTHSLGHIWPHSDY